ncbi:hypothetical protein GQ457_03G005390 [Hibiscus cannabinus]
MIGVFLWISGGKTQGLMCVEGRKKLIEVLCGFCQSDAVKFNVDRASKDELAGCGGVLRCEDGVLRVIFFGLVIGKGTNFVELSAVKIALEVFIEANWKGIAVLLVELYSSLIVSWMNDVSLRPWCWCWWSVLLEIDKLYEPFVMYSVCLVSRHNNIFTGCLARDGVHRLSLFNVWW